MIALVVTPEGFPLAYEVMDGNTSDKTTLVTLKNRLQVYAPGLTPTAVLEKLAGIQMIDVCLQTTDGRTLVMPRYTEPEPEQTILLHKLKLVLPPQPLPLIRSNTHPFPKELLKM